MRYTEPEIVTPLTVGGNNSLEVGKRSVVLKAIEVGGAGVGNVPGISAFGAYDEKIRRERDGTSKMVVCRTSTVIILPEESCSTVFLQTVCINSSFVGKNSGITSRIGILGADGKNVSRLGDGNPELVLRRGVGGGYLGQVSGAAILLKLV